MKHELMCVVYVDDTTFAGPDASKIQSEIKGLGVSEYEEQHKFDAGGFTVKYLREINRCRIYLQAFYITDISTFEKSQHGRGREGKGRRDGGRKSTWTWPVKQRPTSWKTSKLVLKCLAPDVYVVQKLGEWFEQHHKKLEWYLESDHNVLYHHSNGTWEQHTAQSRARL
jgi:hypothetical protein